MQPVKHMWILVMHGKRRSLVLVARLSSTSRTLAVGLNPANPAEAAWGPRTEGLRKEAGPPRRLHCVCTACAVCDARSDVTCGSTQSTGQDRVYSICIPGRALHLRSWMSWTLDLDPLARSARFSPERRTYFGHSVRGPWRCDPLSLLLATQWAANHDRPPQVRGADETVRSCLRPEQQASQIHQAGKQNEMMFFRAACPEPLLSAS